MEQKSMNVFSSPVSASRIYKGLEEEGLISVNELIDHVCWRSTNGTTVIKIPVYEIKEVRRLPDNLSIRLSYGTSFVLEHIILKGRFHEDRYLCAALIEAALLVLESRTYEETFHPFIIHQFFSLVEGDKITKEKKFNIEMLRRFAEKINLELNSHFFNNSFLKQGEISIIEWLDYISVRVYNSQEHLLKELRINNNAAIISQYADERTKMMNSHLLSKFFLTEQKIQKGSLKRLKQFFFTPLKNEISSRQFLDFLFSDKNEVADRHSLNIISYSMQHPLSHYWIASSHNTYLTGDQLISESKVEAYVRVLRQGCRCVELDCWPGEEDNIVIYHGKTKTTKISFERVLHAIKEHAFVTSMYPLILSIEDHCDVKLQRKMAKMFIEIFGDFLLVEPIIYSESELPSPGELKKKIILKHKKISKGQTQATMLQDDYEETVEAAPKAGVLFRSLNEVWIPYMVSLDNYQIFYEQYIEKQNIEKFDPTDRHWSETWFHGVLTGGLKDGYDILHNAVVKENGVFHVGIVCEDNNNNYLLFTWQREVAYHFEIEQVWNSDHLEFTLNGNDFFPTLFNLVTDYQYFPEIYKYPILTKPVPQINAHEKMPWFHPSLSKEDSKFVMSTINVKGSFLVRKSATSEHCLVLAVWFNNCRKGFKIYKADNGYQIGRKKIYFENVVEIIKKCQETALLWIVLTNPITREKAQQILSNSERAEETIERIGSAKLHRQTSEEAQQGSRSSSATDTEELEYGKCCILQDVQLEQLPINSSSYYPYGFSLKSSKENIDFWTSKKDECASWMMKILKAIENSTMIPEDEQVAPTLQLGANMTLPYYKKTLICEIMLYSPLKAEHSTDIIAPELSALVIYCQAATFKETDHLQNGGNYAEVYSHSEIKMTALTTNHPHEILNFHKNFLSRIYPHGLRVTSSNYDPIPFWISGCQMVALNYQTGGGEFSSMQVNDAWFERGGRCGYVLKPESHFAERPDPNFKASCNALYIEIIVLGARNLNLPNKKGQQAALVKMKILGHPRDMKPSNNSKVDLEGTVLAMSSVPPPTAERKSIKKIETKKFLILNPEYAMIKFNVQGRNALTKLVSVGQAIHLVDYLREGYRSVPLKNEYSEKIHLSSLLIHLRVWRQNEIKNKLKDLERNLKKTKNLGRERIKKAIVKLKEVEDIFSRESVK